MLFWTALLTDLLRDFFFVGNSRSFPQESRYLETKPLSLSLPRQVFKIVKDAQRQKQNMEQGLANESDLEEDDDDDEVGSEDEDQAEQGERGARASSLDEDSFSIETRLSSYVSLSLSLVA